MNEIKNVVLSTDLSDSSHLAEETVRFLWPLLGGKLTLLHVVPESGFSFPPPTPEEEAAAMEEKRAALQELAREFGGDCEVVVLRGDPSGVIAQYVNSRGDVDLLVLGRHYYSRLQRLLTGIVADIVSKEVRCPVLRC
jgi:nucleotide-binding universal stress UspA family protein